MSDEVETEPAWKTDPLFSHMQLTEEGIARARARRKALDEKWSPERWEEERRKYGISKA
ncbi:MAG TPA: hypothetical protein VF062_25215 [Candidatus Limnocylindrales bacterium]